MKVLGRFCCYVALLVAIAGGVITALVMVAPWIGEAVMPEAEARKAAASDRIAAWQERKAEEAAYAARAAKAAAVQQAAATSPPAQPSPARVVNVSEFLAAEARPAKQKAKRTEKRPQQMDSDLALGYAPSPGPRLAYENVFGAMRDAAGTR